MLVHHEVNSDSSCSRRIGVVCPCSPTLGRVGQYPTGSIDRILLTIPQNKLRRVLLRSELLKKSEYLLSLAVDNTRRAATPGHNKTVDWIFDTLSAYPDYYDVEIQPFTMPGGKAVFTANGQSLVADYMIYSPAGAVSAPLVLVNNQGCVPVSYSFCLAEHQLT